MERYARDDQASFTEVYDTVAPRVFAYLLRRTQSAAIAEDLLQQTLLQMHRARGTFISGSPVMPWAFAIARRLVIDEQRRDQRNVLSTAGQVGDDGAAGSPCSEPEGLVAARQLAGRLQEELGRLPRSQRAAFELLRLEGLSHVEAAEALGITVTALKLRAHRAYLALRAVINDVATEPETER
jgi:RNA polymerase sigma-70 factor (ECF subfamily)